MLQRLCDITLAVSWAFCRNVCERHRAKKCRRGSYYAEGFKRCTVCDLFLSWRGVECPCCSSVLRTSPRNLKKNVHGEGKAKRINLVNHSLNRRSRD